MSGRRGGPDRLEIEAITRIPSTRLVYGLCCYLRMICCDRRRNAGCAHFSDKSGPPGWPSQRTCLMLDPPKLLELAWHWPLQPLGSLISRFLMRCMALATDRSVILHAPAELLTD